MMSLAVDDDIIAHNPLSRVSRCGKRKSTNTPLVKPLEICKALTIQERNRVLVAARTVLNFMHYVFVVLLAGTGLRPGEARSLKWLHLDLDGETCAGKPVIMVETTFKKRGRLGLPKSRNFRKVELDATLVGLLRALHGIMNPAPDGWVFTNPTGSPLSNADLNKIWPVILGIAGITRWLPMYCLRHTYASILLSKGAKVRFVSRQLGHSTTAITEIVYGRWLHHESNGDLTLMNLGSAMVARPE